MLEKMKLELFVFILFSTVPGLLALGNGAPPEACNNLMPQHPGVSSQPANNDYFIISDAVARYTPGQQYLGTSIAIARRYTGLSQVVFVLAARADSLSIDHLSSCVQISQCSTLFTPLLFIPVELRAESDPFIGFFIQARAESNQESVNSIVGVWTPLNTTMARRATCNGVNGVS